MSIRFIDFDGKEHIFNFKKICKDSSSPSGLHLSARKLLKSRFPFSTIYEEVQLLGTGLIADFFIPDLSVLVEVHGEQHYKFVKRFHKTKAGFKKSQLRDQKKKDWCELNDIIFIELPFDKVDDWPNIIKEVQ